MGGCRPDRPFVGHSRHRLVGGGEQLVSPGFNPARGAGVGRAAVGGIVLEAAVFGGVMGGRYHDAIGWGRGMMAIENQNRMGDDGRGGVAEAFLQHHLDPVGCEYLESGDETRFREGVCVHAEKERSGNAIGRPIFAYGLGGCQDVSFIESPVERGTTVPGSSEGHLLGFFRRFRGPAVVGGDEAWNVDKHGLGGWFARQRMECHGFFSWV